MCNALTVNLLSVMREVGTDRANRLEECRISHHELNYFLSTICHHHVGDDGPGLTGR